MKLNLQRIAYGSRMNFFQHLIFEMVHKINKHKRHYQRLNSRKYFGSEKHIMAKRKLLMLHIKFDSIFTMITNNIRDSSRSVEGTMHIRGFKFNLQHLVSSSSYKQYFVLVLWREYELGCSELMRCIPIDGKEPEDGMIHVEHDFFFSEVTSNWTVHCALLALKIKTPQENEVFVPEKYDYCGTYLYSQDGESKTIQIMESGFRPIITFNICVRNLDTYNFSCYYTYVNKHPDDVTIATMDASCLSIEYRLVNERTLM